MAKNPFNTTAQNLVYHLEVGVGPAILKSFLFLLFIGLVAMLFLATQYQGFKNPRAMDQAQLARTFSETGRLNTRMVRPGDLRMLEEKGRWQPGGEQGLTARPDLVNAPLYPLVLGSAFKLLGTEFPESRAAKYPPEQWVIIPLNLLFCFLSGLFMYLAGRRLFSPRVAFTGLTVYFLSSALWAGAVDGTEVSLASLFASVAFWALTRILTDEGEDSVSGLPLWIPVVVGGAALSLLFLTRYAGIILVPGYLLVLGIRLQKRSIVPILVTLGILLAGAAPWMLRNLSLSGSPFGFAPMYAVHGQEIGQIFMRSYLEVDQTNLNLFRGVIARLLASARLGLTFEDVSLANGVVLSLFVATFFYGFQRPSVRILRWGLLASYGCLIIAGGLFGENQFEATPILVPMVILYGCAFFYLLLDRMQLGLPVLSLAVVVGFITVQSLPLLVTLMPPKPSSYPPYRAPDITLISTPFEQTELLCTDMPWATAWYGGQTSLYLPVTVEQFFVIHDTVQPIRGLYLTMLTRDLKYQSQLIRGNYQSWKPIMDLNPLPNGWPLLAGFPIRGGESVILADRNRWAGN